MVRSLFSSAADAGIHLTADGMRAGIARIKGRIEELDRFDPRAMTESHPPELEALSTAINRSLEKTFGEGTSDFKRFSDAGDLQWSPLIYFLDGPPTPLSEYQEGVATNIQRARSLLVSAIQTLEQDLKEISDLPVSAPPMLTSPGTASRRVFIVHGHDEGSREAVARFLERIGFQAIILHEQANQNRTVIEKFEAHADVGFAVVLLTPDDTGGPKNGPQHPRARQNVILELGYFIGKLGREKVCAIRSGELEIPSDIIGVVWTPYDPEGAWRTALAKELAAAGFDIDWNKVMQQ